MFMEIFNSSQKSIVISDIESGASITEVLSSISGFLKSMVKQEEHYKKTRFGK